MQALPVIFAQSNKPVALAIRLRTLSKWSHIGVVTPCGSKVIESVGGIGVIETPIAEFKARYKNCEETYLPCVSTQSAYTFLRSQLGKPYDYRAFFSIGFLLNTHDENAWICSELVAKALGIIREEYIHRTSQEALYRLAY